MTTLSGSAEALHIPAVQPPPPTRGQLERLQANMLPIATALPEAVHHFAPGMYARELTVPAGMLIVGKAHRFGHLIMVTKGRATVLDEFGRHEVSAGFVQSSKPGIKRAALAHEETTFVTVHLNPTDTQDLGAIELEHIEPESPEFQSLMAQMQEALP